MAHAQEVGSRFPASVEVTDGLRVLRAVPGVDAIFRSRDGRVLYVAAREHDAIDWDRLVEVERGFQEAGNPEVSIAVRAHQGREPRSMFEGLEEL